MLTATMETNIAGNDNNSDYNLPQFNTEYLDEFEKKIINNSVLLSDQENFGINIKSYGLWNLLMSELKKYDIYSFEQVIKEKNKDKKDSTRNKYIDSAIPAIFKGMIAALKNSIK